MNKGNKIVIITSLPIIGYSVKQILSEYFDMDNSRIYHTFTDMKTDNGCDNNYMYIVEPEILLSNYEFFALRRQKTLLISENKTENIQFNVINISKSINHIVDSFQNILTEIDSVSKKEEKKEPLSAREIDVLKLIIKGKINKEIADELFISLNTVLTHRKNITSKLGIKTVSGLTFYAMMNGYITDTDI